MLALKGLHLVISLRDGGGGRVCVMANVYVKVRGQLAEALLSPLRGFWESNFCCQSWQQAPLLMNNFASL